jgi:lipopolysaccharide/colanic/teichoic acid biosynthesis glycosyltransferase
MSAQQTLPEVIFSHSGPAVRSSNVRVTRLLQPREQALPTESRTYEVGKRILDVCFALLLLPIAVPMMVLIGVAIGFTSGWPLVYSQLSKGSMGTKMRPVFGAELSKSANSLPQSGTGAAN